MEGSSGGGGGGNGPRFIAPREEVVYNGKRMRKPVTRRGTDFNASLLNSLKKRKFVRDVRDAEFIQWDMDEQPPRDPEERGVLPGHPEGAKHLLPPSAMEGMPASSVCARYTHTSINKVRYPVNTLCYAPDGRRVISGSSSGEFTLWNGSVYNFETILQAHETAVRTMVFSHSDEYLITGDHGGIIKYWQPNFNNIKVITGAHEQPVRQLCFSPTDLKFASCSDDGYIKIWDFLRGEPERSLEGHGWDVKTVDWHISKGLLASGGKDTKVPVSFSFLFVLFPRSLVLKVRFWDPRSTTYVAQLHAHKMTVNRVRWNLNGNWLLTGARDQTTKLWDLRTLKEIETYRGHKREVTSCAWHPFHEGLFATCSADGCINFHLVGRPDPIAKLDQAHDSAVCEIAWHPFGHTLASCSNDQLLRFWTRNRPGDKFDDRYNLTARQESNVDSARLFRADISPSAAANPLPNAAASAISAAPPGVGLRSSSALPSAASSGASLLSGLDHGASMAIPGMSNSQAKLRRFRSLTVAATNPGFRATATLSFLSYDMLAHTNASKRNFPSTPEAYLDWKFRAQNLLLELKQRDCDVMCLQEVSFYKEFWAQSMRGYYMVYQRKMPMSGAGSKRSRSLLPAYSDASLAKGVAILVRRERMVYKDVSQVRFTDDEEQIKSVAIVATYETAASAAQTNNRVPKVFFVLASVSLSNYNNDEKQLEQVRGYACCWGRALVLIGHGFRPKSCSKCWIERAITCASSTATAWCT